MPEAQYIQKPTASEERGGSEVRSFGMLELTVKAIEAVDECLGEVVDLKK